MLHAIDEHHGAGLESRLHLPLGADAQPHAHVALLRRVPDREVAARFARRLGPEFGEGVARVSAGALAAYARLARLS